MYEHDVRVWAEALEQRAELLDRFEVTLDQYFEALNKVFRQLKLNVIYNIAYTAFLIIISIWKT